MMRLIKQQFHLLILAICFNLTNAVAQVNNVLKEQFNGYTNIIATEKVFMHTNKEVYFPGEQIWFKVYLTNLQNTSSRLSKVAYIELLDDKNAAVSQAKIALTQGLGDGSLILPPNLTNGFYRIKTYTRLMENLGEAAFFEKTVQLLTNTLPQKIAAPSSLHVNFFPEGGDLLENVSCNVGFKVADNYGKGIDIKGVILNQKNDTVAKVKSLKFGIGKFTFQPLSNQVYRLVGKDVNGKDFAAVLPTPVKSGYALKLLNAQENQLTITVETNQLSAAMFLVVHNGKETIDAQKAQVNAGKVTFLIDKDKLSSGVVIFTVFTTEGKPVAERIFFKRPISKPLFNVASLQKTYGKRSKVSVNVELEKMLADSALNGHLSIAVAKKELMQHAHAENIESYLLISSMVNGTIESPGYYFEQPTKEVDEALDNLLITQGWRRFSDESIPANAKSVKYPQENYGEVISGQVVGADNKIVPGGKIYATALGKPFHLYIADIDSSGYFNMVTNRLYGAKEMIFQKDYRLDSTSQIKINNSFYDGYKKAPTAAQNVLSLTGKNWRDHLFNAKIQQIYFKDHNKEIVEVLDTTNFYGEPDKTYKLEDYTRFSKIEDVLREYVSEVRVGKRKGSFQFRVLGKYDYPVDNPLVLLDGVPYFSFNRLVSLNTNTIEKLDVVKDRYYYYGNFYEGILSFVSKQANTLDERSLNPKALIIDYNGLQSRRQFYLPTYETEAMVNATTPDFREALYWNSNVNLDKDGKSLINFYSSDVGGMYTISIQGLSTKGVPVVKYVDFEIK